MKRTFLITAFALILTLLLCGSVFANEVNNEIANTNIEQASLEEPSGSQTLRSNGLTATITYPSSSYIRILFRNTTSSTINDTAWVVDQIPGDTISGPFSISVPANKTRSYDAYVGTYPDGYVTTSNHGNFYWAK